MNKNDLKDIQAIIAVLRAKNKSSPEIERIYNKIEKELKPISPQSRKSKGRELQKTVCAVLSEHTGIPYGYNNEEIQPRLMGGSGTDVVLTGKAREEIPFDIECKNTETFSLLPTIEQAKANTEDGRIWLIVYKRNKLKPVVLLDMETFFEIFFRK